MWRRAIDTDHAPPRESIPHPMGSALVCFVASLLLMLASSIAAAPPDPSWAALSDIALQDSLGMDPEGTIRRYNALANELPASSPVLREALYHLGNARYRAGDLDGAKEHLRNCVRKGGFEQRCYALLNRIELVEEAVRTVPIHWQFDETTHGFVHPRSYGTIGTTRIAEDPAGTGGVLRWETRLTSRMDDQIRVGFARPDPPPRRIRFRIGSDRHDAYIRIDAVDTMGRHYHPPPSRRILRIPGDTEVVVDIELSRLVSAEARSPSLNPVDLDQIIIHNITTHHDPRGPESSLYLDDFEVL